MQISSILAEHLLGVWPALLGCLGFPKMLQGILVQKRPGKACSRSFLLAGCLPSASPFRAVASARPKLTTKLNPSWFCIFAGYFLLLDVA